MNHRLHEDCDRIVKQAHTVCDLTDGTPTPGKLLKSFRTWTHHHVYLIAEKFAHNFTRITAATSPQTHGRWTHPGSNKYKRITHILRIYYIMKWRMVQYKLQVQVKPDWKSWKEHWVRIYNWCDLHRMRLFVIKKQSWWQSPAFLAFLFVAPIADKYKNNQRKRACRAWCSCFWLPFGPIHCSSMRLLGRPIGLALG